MDTALNFNGRHSDSPQEQRRYLWSLQPNGMVPAAATDDGERYRQFCREHYGMKFRGDDQPEEDVS